jgi:hypothetical protein
MPKEAATAYEKGLQISPEHAELKKRLQKLSKRDKVRCTGLVAYIRWSVGPGYSLAAPGGYNSLPLGKNPSQVGRYRDSNSQSGNTNLIQTNLIT